MSQIAALNDDDEFSTDHSCSSSRQGVTKEAQEDAAYRDYHEALRLQTSGEDGTAEELLLSVLESPLVVDFHQNGVSAIGRMLCYSCHKNLGYLRLRAGSPKEAMQHLLEAAELDQTDVTLCYKLGVAAYRAQEYHLSRSAFKLGLEQSPLHWPCLDSLISVLYVLNDFEECVLRISGAFERDLQYAKGRALIKRMLEEQPCLADIMQPFVKNCKVVFALETVSSNSSEVGSRLAEEAHKLRRQRAENRPRPSTPPVTQLPRRLKSATWVELGTSLLELFRRVMQPNSGLSLVTPVDMTDAMKPSQDEIATVSEELAILGKTESRRVAFSKSDVPFCETKPTVSHVRSLFSSSSSREESVYGKSQTNESSAHSAETTAVDGADEQIQEQPALNCTENSDAERCNEGYKPMDTNKDYIVDPQGLEIDEDASTKSKNLASVIEDPSTTSGKSTEHVSSPLVSCVDNIPELEGCHVSVSEQIVANSCEQVGQPERKSPNPNLGKLEDNSATADVALSVEAVSVEPSVSDQPIYNGSRLMKVHKQNIDTPLDQTMKVEERDLDSTMFETPQTTKVRRTEGERSALESMDTTCVADTPDSMHGQHDTIRSDDFASALDGAIEMKGDALIGSDKLTSESNGTNLVRTEKMDMPLIPIPRRDSSEGMICSVDCKKVDLEEGEILSIGSTTGAETPASRQLSVESTSSVDNTKAFDSNEMHSSISVETMRSTSTKTDAKNVASSSMASKTTLRGSSYEWEEGELSDSIGASAGDDTTDLASISRLRSTSENSDSTLRHSDSAEISTRRRSSESDADLTLKRNSTVGRHSRRKRSTSDDTNSANRCITADEMPPRRRSTSDDTDSTDDASIVGSSVQRPTESDAFSAECRRIAEKLFSGRNTNPDTQSGCHHGNNKLAVQVTVADDTDSTERDSNSGIRRSSSTSDESDISEPRRVRRTSVSRGLGCTQDPSSVHHSGRISSLLSLNVSSRKKVCATERRKKYRYRPVRRRRASASLEILSKVTDKSMRRRRYTCDGYGSVATNIPNSRGSGFTRLCMPDHGRRSDHNPILSIESTSYRTNQKYKSGKTEENRAHEDISQTTSNLAIDNNRSECDGGVNIACEANLASSTSQVNTVTERTGSSPADISSKHSAVVASESSVVVSEMGGDNANKIVEVMDLVSSVADRNDSHKKISTDKPISLMDTVGMDASLHEMPPVGTTAGISKGAIDPSESLLKSNREIYLKLSDKDNQYHADISVPEKGVIGYDGVDGAQYTPSSLHIVSSDYGSGQSKKEPESCVLLERKLWPSDAISTDADSKHIQTKGTIASGDEPSEKMRIESNMVAESGDPADCKLFDADEAERDQFHNSDVASGYESFSDLKGGSDAVSGTAEQRRGSKRKRNILDKLKMWPRNDPADKRRVKRGRTAGGLRFEESTPAAEPASVREVLTSLLPSSLRFNRSTMKLGDLSPRKRISVSDEVGELSPSITVSESEDVSNWIDKSRYDSSILGLMHDFLAALEGKRDHRWPVTLPELFQEMYEAVRPQLLYPELWELMEANDVQRCLYRRDASALLLYAELKLDSGIGQDWDGQESAVDLNALEDDLGQLVFLVQDKEFMESKWLESTIRHGWSRYKIWRLAERHDLAISQLLELKELVESSAEDAPPTVIVSPNCRNEPRISLETLNTQLELLQRIRNLDDVQRLFEDGRMDDVVELLALTFNQCGRSAQLMRGGCSVMHRTRQLRLLMEALVRLQRPTDLCRMGEACLHEAMQTYLAEDAAEERNLWAVEVIHVCSIFRSSFETPDVWLVSLESGRRCRMVESLLHLAVHQVNHPDRSSPVPPLQTLSPWLLLHTAVRWAETSAALPSSVRSMPAHLRLLCRSHEWLGERCWCCVDEGALLLHALDVMMAALDTDGQLAYDEALRDAIEQCFFCLYRHPSRRPRHLLDHGGSPVPLTWQRAAHLYYFFCPCELPQFDSYRVASISAEDEDLFRRIVQLIPDQFSPQLQADIVERHISAADDDSRPDMPPPIAATSVTRNIFYLLADYSFKMKQWESIQPQLDSLPLYARDLAINPGRRDSWAAMALARGSQVARSLNSCRPVSASNQRFWLRVDATVRCYRRALQLDPTMHNVWLEFGTFAYTIQAHAGRLLRQDCSCDLDLASFQRLESVSTSMSALVEDSFSTAECVAVADEVDGDVYDDRWLHFYMMAKRAEKNAEPIADVLKLYDRAARLLEQAGAACPRKISYQNPGPLALEALEVYYRQHACLLKYLLREEDRQLPRDQLLVIQRQLDDLQNSNCCFRSVDPDAAKRKRDEAEDAVGGVKRVKISQEGPTEDTVVISCAQSTAASCSADDDLGHGRLAVRCAAGLHDVLRRYPEHYKSLYRLAHYYYTSKYHRNVEWARDLLLGCSNWQSKVHMPCFGLFAERKPGNFFSGIWRIPVEDIDRPGSFAAHMHRSVLLVIQLLKETNDFSALFLMSCRLRATPEPDKKYLRDDERDQLATLSFSEGVQSARASLQLLFHNTTAMVSGSRRLYYLLDLHEAYMRMRPRRRLQLAPLLQQAFTMYRGGTVDKESPVLDQALQFCKTQQALIQRAKLANTGAVAPLGIPGRRGRPRGSRGRCRGGRMSLTSSAAPMSARAPTAVPCPTLPSPASVPRLPFQLSVSTASVLRLPSQLSVSTTSVPRLPSQLSVSTAPVPRLPSQLSVSAESVLRLPSQLSVSPAPVLRLPSQLSVSTASAPRLPSQLSVSTASAPRLPSQLSTAFAPRLPSQLSTAAADAAATVSFRPSVSITPVTGGDCSGAAVDAVQQQAEQRCAREEEESILSALARSGLVVTAVSSSEVLLPVRPSKQLPMMQLPQKKSVTPDVSISVIKDDLGSNEDSQKLKISPSKRDGSRQQLSTSVVPDADRLPQHTASSTEAAPEGQKFSPDGEACADVEATVKTAVGGSDLKPSITGESSDDIVHLNTFSTKSKYNGKAGLSLTPVSGAPASSLSAKYAMAKQDSQRSSHSPPSKYETTSSPSPVGNSWKQTSPSRPAAATAHQEIHTARKTPTVTSITSSSPDKRQSYVTGKSSAKSQPSVNQSPSKSISIPNVLSHEDSVGNARQINPALQASAKSRTASDFPSKSGTASHVLPKSTSHSIDASKLSPSCSSPKSNQGTTVPSRSSPVPSAHSKCVATTNIHSKSSDVPSAHSKSVSSKSSPVSSAHSKSVPSRSSPVPSAHSKSVPSRSSPVPSAHSKSVLTTNVPSRSSPVPSAHPKYVPTTNVPSKPSHVPSAHSKSVPSRSSPVPSMHSKPVPARSSPVPIAHSKSVPTTNVPSRSSPVPSAHSKSVPAISSPVPSAHSTSVPARSSPVPRTHSKSVPVRSNPLTSAHSKSVPARSSPVPNAHSKSVPARSSPVPNAHSKSVPARSSPVPSAHSKSVPTSNVPGRSSGSSKLVPSSGVPSRPTISNAHSKQRPSSSAFSRSSSFSNSPSKSHSVANIVSRPTLPHAAKSEMGHSASAKPTSALNLSTKSAVASNASMKPALNLHKSSSALDLSTKSSSSSNVSAKHTSSSASLKSSKSFHGHGAPITLQNLGKSHQRQSVGTGLASKSGAMSRSSYPSVSQRTAGSSMSAAARPSAATYTMPAAVRPSAATYTMPAAVRPSAATYTTSAAAKPSATTGAITVPISTPLGSSGWAERPDGAASSSTTSQLRQVRIRHRSPQLPAGISVERVPPAAAPQLPPGLSLTPIAPPAAAILQPTVALHKLPPRLRPAGPTPAVPARRPSPADMRPIRSSGVSGHAPPANRRPAERRRDMPALPSSISITQVTSSSTPPVQDDVIFID